MPRSDTTIRQDSTVVLQDLYDGLQMKAIVQHEEMKSSRNCADKPLLTYNKKRRSRWQHWLDDLCLLCDSHRGGITTTSIAVEQTTDGVVFWLVINSGDLEDASVYLAALLDLVKRSQEVREDPDGNTAICEIYTRAIARSPQRVKNYAKRLENVLQRVRPGADADDDWSGRVDAAWQVQLNTDAGPDITEVSRANHRTARSQSTAPSPSGDLRSATRSFGDAQNHTQARAIPDLLKGSQKLLFLRHAVRGAPIYARLYFIGRYMSWCFNYDHRRWWR